MSSKNLKDETIEITKKMTDFLSVMRSGLERKQMKDPKNHAESETKTKSIPQTQIKKPSPTFFR